MPCPCGLTNQDCQSRLKVGVEDMLVSGSIRHEHVTRLPLVSSFLTATFALVQVSTISAQVFSPEFFESRPRAFQLSTIPDKNIWPDLTSAIFFAPKQEIDSIRTILTDAPHPELHASLARSASFKTFYLHTFDQSRNYGRFALDFLFPFRTVNTNTYFAEFHGEFEHPDYLRPSSHRTDLSLGLGQRLIGNGDFLLGVNAFVDTSSVYDKWYWSGGVGFETALNISKTSNYPFGALDLSLNLYKGGGLDLESGVSLLLGDHFDLRLNLAKYRFYDGDYILGWRGGADLRASGGLFGLKYEFGQDRVNSSYHTIGASLCVPLQLENLLEGKWPFSYPNSFLRRGLHFEDLAKGNVTRNWRQHQTVVTARPTLGAWEAPGKVRWDLGQDFSPTEMYADAVWRPRTGEKDELSLGSTIVYKILVPVVVGVTEYGYRWIFGPYKSEPP
jgi:hypothetical protein